MECQLEGKAGYIDPSPPSLADADRPGRYVWQVEFICLLCGRFVANVKVADQAAAIKLPPTLRCRACGGAPVRSGEVEREFAHTEAVEWPRKPIGRPTRAMVAARLAEAS
jgi:hypothetical protein